MLADSTSIPRTGILTFAVSARRRRTPGTSRFTASVVQNGSLGKATWILTKRRSLAGNRMAAGSVRSIGTGRTTATSTSEGICVAMLCTSVAGARSTAPVNSTSLHTRWCALEKDFSRVVFVRKGLLGKPV